MTIPILIEYLETRATELEKEAWEHDQHGRNYSAIESTAKGKACKEIAIMVRDALANEQRQGQLL